MESRSFKFLAMFFAFFISAFQTVDGQGTCTCRDPGEGRIFTIIRPTFSEALAACPVNDNCDSGFLCSSQTCEPVRVMVHSSGQMQVSCGVRENPTPCISETGEGTGDPHLTGFDGLKFQFHGIHGKSYVVFGRPSGDTLVTKMKETQRTHHASGAKATFFNEFGLQVADSNDRIRVYLARDSLREGLWLPNVEVNEKEIKESVNLMSCRVKFRPGEKWISIITKDSQFSIFARHPEDENLHHLNLKIGLTTRPSPSETYIGILGVTLNNALGRDIDPDLDVTGRAETLETAMRSRFEVQSLFPPRNNGRDMMLSGVVRMLSVSDIEDVDKTWSAGTYSS